MKIAAKSDIGNIRKENEDRYFIAPDKKAAAIADGMGGHENGKIAAYIAIETFAAHREEIAESGFSEEKFALIMQKINQAVYDYKQTEAAGKMMGTTFSGIVVEKNTLFLAHVGDSRVYLYRRGILSQLTEEHSYLAELLRSGKDTENIPNIEKNKHILTKAIGPEKMVEGQISTFPLEDGDVILLCTDGLYNKVSDLEITAALETNNSIEDIIAGLVSLALQRGGNDNITLVLCRYEQEEA